MAFHARKRELAVLEKRYERGAFECVVIYGRRRVGKTRLMRKFSEGKRVVFFSALESSSEMNLNEFSKAISALIAPGLPSPSYSSFIDALDVVFTSSREQRTVLVIDEYPYLAAAEPSFSSILQHAIDHGKDGSRLMIILCGSSTSFMEEQVLGKKSPLYGRRTAQLKLEPFDFHDARYFLPDADTQLSMELYALSGGIPRYLEELDGAKSLETNLHDAVLDPSCYLFEEPKNLLMQELRSPKSYTEVIKAIAEGSTRTNQIATAANVDTSLCSYYLHTLTNLGLVAKESPIDEGDDSKHSIWKIQDSFFRFWYRFIPANWSLLQAGHLDAGTARVTAGYSDYMGAEFERICMQWLWRNNVSNLPFLMLSCGRWWGTDNRSKQQEEIDIVCKGEQSEMLFCECKWRNDQANAKVLEKLIWRSERFAARERYYAIFSKSGFTAPLVTKASSLGNVLLISLNDM